MATLALAGTGAARPMDYSRSDSRGGDRLTSAQRKVLHTNARDTWRSFVRMTNDGTGLTADNISAGGASARYTSPTNIATYIWSTLAARDLQIIKPGEARARISKTLDTLATMERYSGAEQPRCAGQYYNWYDPATGDKLTVWPVDGGVVYPFLSSVDNGWLAAALIMVRNSEPRLRAQANAVYSTMDWLLLRPQRRAVARQLQPDPPPGCDANGFTCHHYGSLNTEPRIASTSASLRATCPATASNRTFPSTRDWGWQEARPEGVTRTYQRRRVEATISMQIVRALLGRQHVRGADGSALVPEEQWAGGWGVNHPLYVQAQIQHGLNEPSTATGASRPRTILRRLSRVR
ncbi:MAG: DUF3131 domain-containing protein [Chloroflexia bacterium]